jgi:WD40 repeat protein
VQNKQGEIQLWEAATSQPLGPLFPIDGAPHFISDSGRYILAGQHDAVQIWDTVTGKRCGEQLPGCHEQMAAAFNPAGSMLATYEWFDTRLWDCATGIALGPGMPNTSSGEDDLDFSPDGRWLLSTDGRVNVFRVPQPAIDEPERLQLLVETRTGLRVDENGTIQVLRYNEWRERMRKLEEISTGADADQSES